MNCRKLVEKAVSQVTFEIGQIDHLFSVYADLLQGARAQPPDHVQATAIASVVHSFYNGVENVFRVIAKHVDRSVPDGDHWHQDLLDVMAQATAHRAPAITLDTAGVLRKYLAFRHFYRHSYSFLLEWDELRHLADPLPDFWREVKSQLEGFVRGLTP